MRLVRTLSIGLGASIIAVADIPEGVSAWQPWAGVLGLGSALLVALRRYIRPVGAILSLIALSGIAVGAELAGSAGQLPIGTLLAWPMWPSSG
ncbi:MAG: hypothetical protein AB8G14_03740 [Ilumatobacter sp.]